MWFPSKLTFYLKKPAVVDSLCWGYALPSLSGALGVAFGLLLQVSGLLKC